MDAPDAGPSAPAEPSLPPMLDSAQNEGPVAEPSASSGPGMPPGKQRRRKEHVDYEVVYEAVRDRPLTVESLLFHGLGRTRPELVVREFRRLHRAETLDDVRQELLEAHDALKALGPYDRVEVVLGDSATGHVDAYKVVVRCHEKQRTRYKAAMYVEGTEVSGEASVAVRNAAGLGEEVEVAVKVGSQSSSEGRMSATRGRLGGQPYEGTASIFQATQSYEAASSYVERLRGAIINIGSQDGQHAVAYELGWRTLSDPSRRASLPVRQQLGDHLKSAVSYAVHRDEREPGEDGFYTSGSLLRASAELAGVGLDAKLLRYAKAQAGAALAFPLGFFGTAVSLRAEVGALLPWGPGFASQPTCISDRFFIGGVASNLRGFAFKGAGPSAPRRRGAEDDGAGTTKRDALGGDLMCTLMAALHFPLPFEAPRALGLHGHVFLNGGSVELLSGTGRTLRQGAADFLQSFRWSAGIGLVWPTNIGLLEVNWCRVLAHQPTDTVRHGLEVGFSPVTS